MAINLGSGILEKETLDTGGGGGTVDVSESDNMAKATLEDCKKQFESQIRESGLVDKLTSEIVLSDTSTIVNFGRKSAEEMSACADDVINTYDMMQLSNVSGLLGSLSNIMNKFDKEALVKIEEIEVPKKRWLFGTSPEKLIEKAQEAVKNMMAKYDTIADNLQSVCTELKVYEREIQISNSSIEKMYQANINSYKTLLAYVIAGSEALNQIEDYRLSVEKEVAESGDPVKQMELQNVDNAKQLLTNVLLNLKSAETVALQSLPMLKASQYNNDALTIEINSSIIVTMPIFKQAIAQALLNKRQKMQAMALSKVREATGQMWEKNVEMSVENMKLVAQLGGGAGISTEQLESSWNKIMTGIEESKKIKSEIEAKNQSDIKKLEALNDKYLACMSGHKIEQK